MNILYLLFLLFGVFVVSPAKMITYNQLSGVPYSVTYDAQSFSINDQRTIFLAGEVHYGRSTPGMWNNILGKASAQGLNAIQTYVFWNLHEHVKGQVNFSSPDLGLFLQLAAKNNLFVVLRLGPYCDAEWNYGCYPVWLGQIPGIVPRSYNQPWLQLMQSFFASVMTFVEPYLAKNGGPIIMAQIENEYNGNDWAYLDWIAQLVKNYTSLCPTWIMCQGQSVNGTISTCDDCSCVEFAPGHVKSFPSQPLMNTEDHGFNQRWGWAPSYRTVVDLAFGVSQWFAIGGTYHSYYMWHGGNNYARNAASGIATEYANDVLLYSDGIPHEPKYSHLASLHFILAQYSDVISGQLPPEATQMNIWDGSHWVPGDVYGRLYGNPVELGFVISFLSDSALVQFANGSFLLPSNSVSLVSANSSVLWNSATYVNITQNYKLQTVSANLQWMYWSEPVGESQSRVNGTLIPFISSLYPLEQLNVTQDDTIYLWYKANVSISVPTETSKLSFNGRKANAYLLFLDGLFKDSFQDYEHAAGVESITLTFNSTSMKGTYLLEILSISLGIDSAGYIERKGIVSNVTFNGLTVLNWTHQKGMTGEYLQIYAQGANAVPWKSNWNSTIGKSSTWFTTTFTLPSDIMQFINNPLFLNVTGLSRGHAYVNGMDIGLYWTLPGLCNYAPPSYGCQQGLLLDTCGLPTQILYHIPPDWLFPGKNTLSILEDTGMNNLASVNLVQKIVL